MKNVLTVIALIATIIFTGCSKTDEDFNLDNLSGSKWERSYHYENTDDGTWEDCTYTLTFTSLSKAELYAKYNGYEWTWQDKYQSYSGSWTKYFSYNTSGDAINLTCTSDENWNDMTLYISGNKLLTDYGDEWTLISN